MLLAQRGVTIAKPSTGATRARAIMLASGMSTKISNNEG